MEVTWRMGIFESSNATTSEEEASTNVDQDGRSHSASEVPDFKAVVVELVEQKATLMRYLENAHHEEDARKYSTQQPSFIALVAKIIGLKASLSSDAKSHATEETKLDPSQHPDFTAVMADVAESKATMA